MSRLLQCLASLAVAVAGVAAYPGDLAARASSSTFSLYAYGSSSDTEIGGFPVFWDDGLAYIANPAKVNHTSGYVSFTKNSTTWLANPVSGLTVDWENAPFYVPIGSGPTGFYTEGISNVTTDEILTTGFKTYGSTAMISIDGTLYTEWYAVATAVDGLWSVGWNATGGHVLDAELITLRKVAGGNVATS